MTLAIWISNIESDEKEIALSTIFTSGSPCGFGQAGLVQVSGNFGIEHRM